MKSFFGTLLMHCPVYVLLTTYICCPHLKNLQSKDKNIIILMPLMASAATLNCLPSSPDTVVTMFLPN